MSRMQPPAAATDVVRGVIADMVAAVESRDATGRRALIDELIADNDVIDATCINLNPATNVLSPRVAAALASSMGMRPSLGHPGEKYEMGLEAIERVEVVCAALACEVFGAPHAEVRVTSGAMANLVAFMACAKPGDAVVVPPGSIGGHVTHHKNGAAGLYGLDVHEAPVDVAGFTVDTWRLRDMVQRVRPKVISIGGSLNLHHHPVAEVREIADEVGAKVLFDAAHLSGVIAGGAWPNPLAEGAHMMTCSTYKSLGGPPSGLLMTNDDEIAARVDAIVYPGLTANFDASSVAALAMALVDWQEHGAAYAAEMCASASALHAALVERGVAVYDAKKGTASHQVAVDARNQGGGDALARKLRTANLLASGIGLPVVSETPMPGMRLGTPEIVRLGMTSGDMPALADLIARAIASDDPSSLAAEATALRQRFTAGLAFVG